MKKLLLISLILGSASVFAQGVNFTLNKTSGCAPLTITATASNNPNFVNYYWDYGDGNFSYGPNKSTTYTYNDVGVFDVYLEVYDINDNYIGDRTKIVTVSGAGVVSSLTAAGIGEEIYFASTGDATSIIWDFGDGIGTSTDFEPTYTYSSFGTYIVTATSQSPTCGTVVQTITITIADYSYTTNILSVCVPADVQFVFNGNDPNATNFYWDFGDGSDDFGSNSSINHTYTQGGTYYTSLYVFNSNFNFIASYDVTVIISGPSASLSSTFASVNDIISFYSGGIYTSVNWDFGDGSSSFIDNPSHSYSATGTYTVNVTFQTSTCGAITQSFDITIGDYAFTINPSANICEGSTVAFNYTGTSTNVVNYYWDYGDGNSDFLASTSTSHTYDFAGDYTITIELYDANFNTIGQSSQMITINAKPSVNLSPLSDICNTGNIFTLTNGSPSGGQYFVNGVAATSFNPSTANLGSNTITYTYTDQNTCANTASGSINVLNCASLDEKNIGSFTLFPNPTSSILYLQGEKLASLQNIELRDELGRLVLVFQSENLKILDLSSLNNGIYVLTFIGENFTEVQKVQISKN